MFKLINLSIQYRKCTVALFMLIALTSIIAIQNSNIDIIPDLGENQQIVFTEWPGRSPQDIEAQITYPLSTLLQGIPGVKTVRATSAFGFSTIYVIFESHTDFYWSRSRIIEKLIHTQSQLPSGVQPQLGPDATGLGQIFWYSLEYSQKQEDQTSQPQSLAHLRTLQDFYVKYHLQSVEGVSEVASVGGFVKEYQIDVDPQKLFAFDVHFSTLIQAIQNSNIDVGAKIIEDGDREFIIRGKGFFRSLADIENTVIAIKNKTPIFIKDVAHVNTGPAFRRGVLDKNGFEVVGGVVTMRYGENPQKVIQNIKEKLQEIKQGLPQHVHIIPFYDRTEPINNTMTTVYTALTQQVLLATLIVFLFLLHIPSAFLVSLTLPLAIAISFILMKCIGIESHIMSLSGMIIAIGTIVDMGIIMTENIYQKLSLHRPENKKQQIQIITSAAKEISPAIMTSITTTIITFLPVLALQDIEGKLFWPLAWAKTFTLLGSLIVAVLLIPALSVFFFQNIKTQNKDSASHSQNPLAKGQAHSNKALWHKFIFEKHFSNEVIENIHAWIHQTYKQALTWVLDHRKLFLIAPAVLLILGIIAWTQLDEEFMPEVNEGDILYMPVTTPDISISKARELLSYTDKIIKEHPLVEFAVGKLGRANSALDPAPIAMMETIIKLIPQSQWSQKGFRGQNIYDVMEDLDQALQIPGLVNSWGFPMQTRIGMISTGIKTQVGIKIFGDDISVLEKLSSQVAQEIKKIKGAYGVYQEQITSKPYIEFNIDRVAAAQYGINIGTIQTILQTAVGGMPIGQFYEGRQRYAIRVRYKKELRDRIDQLKTVLVPSPVISNGVNQHIPLNQLADIRVVTGPAQLSSENGILRSLVLFNVRDNDLVSFVEKAKALIEEKIHLPTGYSLSWAGQYENHTRANNYLKILLPLVLIVNLIILFLSTRSFSYSLIIFSAVPIAMTGGLILLWLTGFHLSVAVWIGFIALFGIAVDDGILMITYLKQAMDAHPVKNLQDLKSIIIQAGTRRIRPLLMTTMTTIFALLPVIWSTSTGSEVMKPMAIPTLGGMLVEVITLFIVPVLFSFTYQFHFKENSNIH